MTYEEQQKEDVKYAIDVLEERALVYHVRYQRDGLDKDFDARNQCRASAQTLRSLHGIAEKEEAA